MTRLQIAPSHPRSRVEIRDSDLSLCEIGIDAVSGILCLKTSFSVTQRSQWASSLRSTEPEGHLDRWADFVRSKLSANAAMTVVGFSYKDDSMLERLSSSLTNLIRLEHLGPSFRAPMYGTELNAALESAEFRPLIGSADLCVMRHLLEHEDHPTDFLSAVERLLTPAGRLLIEVPASENAIRHLDYSVIWEHHTWYFTTSSLSRLLLRNGWRIESIERVESDGEWIICAIASRRSDATVCDIPEGPVDRALLERFVHQVPHVTQRVRSFLSSPGLERVVFLGAGHITSTISDLFLPQGLEAVAIDDNPTLQDRFIGKGAIPILRLESVSPRANDIIVCSLNEFRATAFIERVRGKWGRDQKIVFASELASLA